MQNVARFLGLPLAGNDVEIGQQGEMVRGEAGERRADHFRASHRDGPADEDMIEPQQRGAARKGRALAGEADTVIVTGKGHEPTQEIAGVFHRCNDRDVFLAARDERAGAAR